MIRLFLILALLPLPALAESATIGVVYSTAAVQIRRIIVPDTDEQLTKQNWTGPGETLLIIPRGAEITGAIFKATGKQPTEPRVLETDVFGNPLGAIMADPVLDAMTGIFLVPDVQEITLPLTLDSLPK